MNTKRIPMVMVCLVLRVYNFKVLQHFIICSSRNHGPSPFIWMTDEKSLQIPSRGIELP